MPFCHFTIRACRPTRNVVGLPTIRLPNPPLTLGEHLLVARYNRGFRQQDVARDLNVDEISVTNWETGKHQPEVRFLPRIYVWLGFCPVTPGPITFGQRVRRCREGVGLSRQALAERLGRDNNTLRPVEMDSPMKPTRRVRRAIEGFLGAP